MVDDGGGDPVALEQLEDAAGGVDAADAVLSVEQHDDRGQRLEGGDLGVGLGAVGLDGQAGGALHGEGSRAESASTVLSRGSTGGGLS